MNIRSDKTEENKSQSVSNAVSQGLASSESTFQFVDNRSISVAQRRLRELAGDSPNTQRVVQKQILANNLPLQEPTPIQKKENNTGLPDNLKSGIENLSGYSMDDVKVHYNSNKPAQLHAHAYAQGTDIHLASGQERHLPHEAWHVVQQKQGRVKPTMQMKGKVNVNDDAGLEKEADVMGEIATNWKVHSDSQPKETNASQGAHPVQRVWNKDGDIYRWDRLKDGVEWCTDEAGNMWFEIKDPSLIKVGKQADYETLQGKKKTWSEWNSISVIPVLTAHDTQTAFDGWHDNSRVDWSQATNEWLAQMQENVIRYGIEPLITELLDHLPPEVRRPVFERMGSALGKLRIYNRQEFAVRSYHFAWVEKGGAGSRPYDEIEQEVIGYWKEKVSRYDPKEKILKEIEDVNGGIQGQAMDGYQCINAGGAFPGQGLHLIIHETMHNLAHPGFAESLRKTPLGDEGLNEYFARLATLTLRKHPITEESLAGFIGSPKGGIERSNSSATKALSGRGVYGDLMDQDGYHKIKKNISREELVALAKKYFLNLD
ncbi:hypothetical protein FUAX_07350 [Fulvitalea axinellae]|uniref:eCIS core domain-containing protein n=1 Tax=Fulvitalea axinellae TaxID=1182444 RepID=A0AAU9CXH0_9BACT|nr:hypothetical protein FUAX_07350 [Fulvitalea axinellae]